MEKYRIENLISMEGSLRTENLGENNGGRVRRIFENSLMRIQECRLREDGGIQNREFSRD